MGLPQPSCPRGRCCPAAQARPQPIALARATGPAPGRGDAPRAAKAAVPTGRGEWPARAFPRDPGMTQRAWAGASRAISAAAAPETASYWAAQLKDVQGGPVGELAWPDPRGSDPAGGRGCQTPAMAEAGPAGCLHGARPAAGQGPERAAQTLPAPVAACGSELMCWGKRGAQGAPGELITISSSSPAQAGPHGASCQWERRTRSMEKAGKWHFVQEGISTGNLCFHPLGSGWERPSERSAPAAAPRPAKALCSLGSSPRSRLLGSQGHAASPDPAQPGGTGGAGGARAVPTTHPGPGARLPRACPGLGWAGASGAALGAAARPARGPLPCVGAR